MQTTIDEQQLKDLLKAAFVEVMQERPELIRNVMEETLEDIGLARAIEEGKDTGTISHEEVFAILRGQA